MSYFTTEKKRKAIEQLKICLDCADKAGIRHAMFINFGLLLGMVREHDFISHDSDVDICIKQELITAKQEMKYFKLLQKKGMFFARRKWSSIDDENGFYESLIVTKGQKVGKKIRFTWFSLRMKKDYPKFCHWFMFPWKGIYWHTKAGRWVKKRKFDPNIWHYDKTTEGIMKGIPEMYLDELITTEFYGLKLQIPKYPRACLDFMYPGWLIPHRGGASSKKIVCIVGKWSDKKTWRIDVE